MKKKLFIVPFLCMFLFLCQGCSKEEAYSPNEEATPTISITNEDEIQPVGSNGGVQDIAFNVSTGWTATVSSSAAEWLSVFPTNGEAGYNSIMVTAKENDDYDERNASVTINYGDKKYVITIAQKQKNALIVSSNKIEIESGECEFSINIQANVSVSYEIDENAISWISPVSDSRGLTASALSFNATANENSKPRQGVITIKGGNDITETVTVYQAGNMPTLVLTQSEYIVSSRGEVIKVELRSNTSYSIEMPGVDWVTIERTRNISTYTHYFMIAPNDSYDSRTAEIKFVDKENGLEQTVEISQLQKDAIILAQNVYEMPAEGGNLDFNVQSNVEFEVAVSENWITQTASRGLVGTDLHFSIAPNESEATREADITVSKDDIVQVVRIIQSGKSEEIKPYLEISRNSYSADKDGDSFYVTVQSNVKYMVYISEPSWIFLTSQNGNQHSFEVIANSTMNSRTGYISFTNDEYGLEKTVAVTQLGQDISIIVPENTFELAASDNYLQFDIETNANLDVNISAEWLTLVSGNVTPGTNSLVFNVEANTTTSPREAVITFTAPDYSYRTVRVVQNGIDAPYMIITSSPNTISAQKQEISIVAISNFEDFNVAFEHPEWISLTNAVPILSQDGTYTLTYTFIIEENKSEDTRANMITFSNSRYEYSKSVDIMQEGQEVPDNVTGNGNESYDKEDGVWDII